MLCACEVMNEATLQHDCHQVTIDRLAVPGPSSAAWRVLISIQSQHCRIPCGSRLRRELTAVFPVQSVAAYGIDRKMVTARWIRCMVKICHGIEGCGSKLCLTCQLSCQPFQAMHMLSHSVLLLLLAWERHTVTQMPTLVPKSAWGFCSLSYSVPSSTTLHSDFPS